VAVNVAVHGDSALMKGVAMSSRGVDSEKEARGSMVSTGEGGESTLLLLLFGMASVIMIGSTEM